MQRKIALCLLAAALIVLFAGFTAAQQKFVAALNAEQAVPPNDSTARGVCNVSIGTRTGLLNVTCTYEGLSGDLKSADVYVRWGGIEMLICPISKGGGTSGTVSQVCDLPYGPPLWTTSLPGKMLSVELRTANFPNAEIRGQIKVVTIDNDMDGDGRADPFVFRSSDNYGYMYCSTDGETEAHQFVGSTIHTPFMADFDGDGLGDISDTRFDLKAGEMQTIYIRSSDNVLVQVSWRNLGLGDQAAFADYDGDGKIDIALFRQSDGNWFILQSSDGTLIVDQWGMAADRSVPADYDKDGKADLAIVRSENGRLVWYIRRSSDGTYYGMQWGLSSDTFYPDKPVDLDADGANDILVSRDVAGSRYFYGLQSSNGALFARQWGFTSDAVKLGDFDGDGKTEIAAIRNSDASLVWYFSPGADGQMKTLSWGLTGDQ